MYLQGKFAGVTIRGNNVIMGGGGASLGVGLSKRPGVEFAEPAASLENPNAPLYLLDGFPVSNDILATIPMATIDKVEVLKYGHETTVFGMRGVNGVVAVYTKLGVDFEEDQYIPGTISERIFGYSPNRSFYSPKYTVENKDAEKPDNRITLYWNQSVTTENGKATVSFFTADDEADFVVVVQGISSTGKICYGISDFSVLGTVDNEQ